MGVGIWFGKNKCPFSLGIVKEVTAVDCDCNVNKARVQEEGEYVGLSLQQHPVLLIQRKGSFTPPITVTPTNTHTAK